MPSRIIEIDAVGAVPVSYTDRGAGHAFLLLHGGAGPQSVIGFADLLAAAAPGRVVVPVHPGFDGTARPAGLSDVAALAALYVRLIDELGLDGVSVIGNSLGGWIAAEMAVAASARISDVTFVDAVGIVVPGHPVADFFSLTLDQVAELSYHDPDRFRINPAAMSAE
ncbi:MAG TPA: alpha/beta hydrolase, partial [Streptosporangiaceae bacterium]|nr:alpha/beta hydrolase [Streptosporangiaceae bacterium]